MANRKVYHLMVEDISWKKKQVVRQIDRNIKGVQKAWKLGPAAVGARWEGPRVFKANKNLIKISFLLSAFWRIHRTGAQRTCLLSRVGFSLLIEAGHHKDIQPSMESRVVPSDTGPFKAWPCWLVALVIGSSISGRSWCNQFSASGASPVVDVCKDLGRPCWQATGSDKDAAVDVEKDKKP